MAGNVRHELEQIRTNWRIGTELEHVLLHLESSMPLYTNHMQRGGLRATRSSLEANLNQLVFLSFPWICDQNAQARQVIDGVEEVSPQVRPWDWVRVQWETAQWKHVGQDREVPQARQSDHNQPVRQQDRLCLYLTGGFSHCPHPPRPLDGILLCQLCLHVCTLYMYNPGSASTPGPSGASRHRTTPHSSTVIQSQMVTFEAPLHSPAYGKRANLTVKPKVQCTHCNTGTLHMRTNLYHCANLYMRDFTPAVWSILLLPVTLWRHRLYKYAQGRFPFSRRQRLPRGSMCLKCWWP